MIRNRLTKFALSLTIKQAEPAMMQVADTLTDMGMSPGNRDGEQKMIAARIGIERADNHPEQNRAARLAAYKTLSLVFLVTK